MMDESDELYELRLHYYHGLYDACVQSYQDSAPALTDPAGRAMFFYMLKSLLVLERYDEAAQALAPLGGDSDAQAMSILTKYLVALKKGDTAKAHLVEQMRQFSDSLASGDDGPEAAGSSNANIRLALATVLVLERDYTPALETLQARKGSRNIEAVAMTIQIALVIGRRDIAGLEYEQAKKWAGEHVLLQLCEAWLGLAEGGENYNQAFYVYNELSNDPRGASSAISTGQAVATAARGNALEAEEYLKEAVLKGHGGPDVYANLVISNQLKGKPFDPTDAHLSKLREMSPQHPFLSSQAQLSVEFDALAAQYAG